MGMCARHYEEDRKARAPKCSHDGCNEPQRSKGLCEKHYREHLSASQVRCSVTGCERNAVAGGLCDTHRKRKERHGHLDPTRSHDWGGKEAHPLYDSWQWMRRQRGKIRKLGQVTVCQEWLDDFWRFVHDVGDRPDERHKLRRRDEGAAYSKENCYWAEPVLPKVEATGHAEYMRKWQKQYREKNPERYFAFELKRRFGIEIEQYTAMLEEQRGVCAICGKAEAATHRVTGQVRRMAVDHCHETGKIRGLLCTHCNAILGHAKDRTEVLEAAIRYLRKHE